MAALTGDGYCEPMTCGIRARRPAAKPACSHGAEVRRIPAYRRRRARRHWVALFWRLPIKSVGGAIVVENTGRSLRCPQRMPTCCAASSTGGLIARATLIETVDDAGNVRRYRCSTEPTTNCSAGFLGSKVSPSMGTEGLFIRAISVASCRSAAASKRSTRDQLLQQRER